MTTTQPPSLPVLKDLAEDAGLDAKVSQLLVDHGITNSGTFFYTFQDPSAVKKLLSPTTVGEGVKLSTGTAVKLDDVQYMVALSVVAHMVDEIRVAKAKREGALQSAGTTPTAAAAVSTAATKAPKVLPEGYWAEFLAEFQSEKIGGIARQFPTHFLSGADEILARLVHERVTRSHTPLKLGEIVAHRQFTASGQINPFRIKEEPGSRMLLRDDGLFDRDRAPRHVPEPQRLQTFLDFLESVKYGLLFARWGPQSSRSTLGSGGSPTSFEITHSGTHSCVNFTCAVPGRCAWNSGKASRSRPPTRLWFPRQTLRRRLRATSPPTPKGAKGEQNRKFKTVQSESEGNPRKRPGPYRTGTGQATGSQSSGQGQQGGVPQCRLFAAGHCKFGASCKCAHAHTAPHKPQPPVMNPAVEGQLGAPPPPRAPPVVISGRPPAPPAVSGAVVPNPAVLPLPPKPPAPVRLPNPVSPKSAPSQPLPRVCLPRCQCLSFGPGPLRNNRSRHFFRVSPSKPCPSPLRRPTRSHSCDQ